MRKCCKALILFIVLLAVLTRPALAAEEVWDMVDTGELEREAYQYTDLPLSPGISLEEGLSRLWKQTSSQIQGVVTQATRSSAIILTVSLFCAVAQSMGESVGTLHPEPVRLVGVMALMAAAVGDMGSLLETGRQTVERLTDLDRVLIPTLTTAAAASGSVSGAATRQMVTLLCANLLLSLMNSVFIPGLYLSLAASAGAAAAGDGSLRQIAALVQSLIQSALKWLLLLFTAYLSVSGVITGSADKAAAKLARFAISGMVPVVGGILSDATESVLAGAGVLRSAIGVLGTVAVLGCCVLPFLRLGIQYLLYRAAAMLTAILAGEELSGLIGDMGTAFGLILAMTGAAALITLISVMLTVGAAIT